MSPAASVHLAEEPATLLLGELQHPQDLGMGPNVSISLAHFPLRAFPYLFVVLKSRIGIICIVLHPVSSVQQP